jgi:hypothetical protein
MVHGTVKGTDNFSSEPLDGDATVLVVVDDDAARALTPKFQYIYVQTDYPCRQLTFNERRGLLDRRRNSQNPT